MNTSDKQRLGDLFEVVQTYIKTISFESEAPFLNAIPGRAPFKMNNMIRVDELTSQYVSNDLCEAILHVTVSETPEFDPGAYVYYIEIEYAALLKFVEPMEREDMEKIAKELNPEILYDAVRGIIYNLSKESGAKTPCFPQDWANLKAYSRRDDDDSQTGLSPLTDYSDDEALDVYEEEEDDDDGIDDYSHSLLYQNPVGFPEEGFDQHLNIVSYEYLVGQILEMDEYREFADSLYCLANVEAEGRFEKDIFEKTIGFQFYYRFFNVVPYNHPQYENISDDLYDILYRLLWGSENVSCRMVEKDAGLPSCKSFFNKTSSKLRKEGNDPCQAAENADTAFPDLLFSYSPYSSCRSYKTYIDRTVSSLSRKEFLLLLYDLLKELYDFAEVKMVNGAMPFFNATIPYENGYLISKKDYSSLFNRVENIPDSVDVFYKRIKDCHSDTSLYNLLTLTKK